MNRKAEFGLSIPETWRPFMVGFDDVFDRVLSAQHNSLSYPPYNIVKHTETEMTIEIAVAGFSKNEIDVSVENNVLTVKGSKTNTEEKTTKEYTYKGISEKDFVRKWNLGSNIEVKTADLKDGMLTVDLEKVVPEHLKPRTIPIGVLEHKDDEKKV